MHSVNKLCAYILKQRKRVIDLQAMLCACPALSPQNGGKGELAKAELIQDWLEEANIAFTRVDSPDPDAEKGLRPNIIAVLPGRLPRKLWLFAHMDVVPAGDLSAWKTEPWQAMPDGDFIIGRGVEDNQQAITSMLVLAESFRKLEIQPEIGLGLVFLADEECGSRHGMSYVLANRASDFSADDYYIVPDGGSESGAEIEIAEKAQLWLKFTVTGQQAHASMPGKGKNAFVVASQLVLVLQSLYSFFPARNDLFNPPFSTFVPTRHEENVPAINILPGRDVFFLDCRLLPELPVQNALDKIHVITEEVSRQTGLKIDFEIVSEQAASATPPNTPGLFLLEHAIKEVYGVAPKPIGIGGATVASFLRREGLPALVWSRILGTCHQPNEKSSISFTLSDAAVFARILMAVENGYAPS